MKPTKVEYLYSHRIEEFTTENGTIVYVDDNQQEGTFDEAV